MRLFPNTQSRKHNHGHRSYQTPSMHDATLDSLVPYVNSQLRPHHIRTQLYAVPLRVLITLD